MSYITSSAATVCTIFFVFQSNRFSCVVRLFDWLLYWMDLIKSYRETLISTSSVFTVRTAHTNLNHNLPVVFSTLRPIVDSFIVRWLQSAIVRSFGRSLINGRCGRLHYTIESYNKFRRTIDDTGTSSVSRRRRSSVLCIADVAWCWWYYYRLTFFARKFNPHEMNNVINIKRRDSNLPSELKLVSLHLARVWCTLYGVRIQQLIITIIFRSV